MALSVNSFLQTQSKVVVTECIHMQSIYMGKDPEQSPILQFIFPFLDLNFIQ